MLKISRNLLGGGGWEALDRFMTYLFSHILRNPRKFRGSSVYTTSLYIKETVSPDTQNNPAANVAVAILIFFYCSHSFLGQQHPISHSRRQIFPAKSDKPSTVHWLGNQPAFQ